MASICYTTICAGTRAASRRCRRTWPPHRPQGALRLCSTSALGAAARSLQDVLLAACIPDELPPVSKESSSSAASVMLGSSSSSSSSGSSSSGSSSSNWAALRGQAAMVSGWPTHPFEPSERLALAETLSQRPADMDFGSARRGGALCSFYRQLLLESESGVFGVRSAGTARCALVCFSQHAELPAAASEATALLLAGYAVTLAAPCGPALDAAQALVDGFPPQLLQAEALDKMTLLPNTVAALRGIGLKPRECWPLSGRTPPVNFGGYVRSRDGGVLPYGIAATAPLEFARIDIEKLSRSSRARVELSDEASDLLALLSVAPAKESPVAPGLPPPRWALSAYDRGTEEVHDLVDLLWAFSRQFPSADCQGVTLAPADKHFILTSGGTTVPEDIAKAAAVSALSPGRPESITLHAVGLGPRGLSHDPLRGFCRLVTSGRSGMEWRVKEHESWPTFLQWLRAQGSDFTSDDAASTVDGPGTPYIFGSLPNAEGSDRQGELRQLAAHSRGISWATGKDIGLFAPDPLDQLRRWTTPMMLTADQVQQRKASQEILTAPSIEVVPPKFIDVDD